MKIAIIGYGKMGKEIEKIAIERGHFISKVIDNSPTLFDLENADVAIEFSQPDCAFQNIKVCLDAGIPVLSGTTGWLGRKPDIEKYCTEKNGTFLYASNYSLGVNLFFELNKRLADLMKPFPTYKASMEEIHHTQKLDAPSGTAISLANDILPILNKKSWVLDKSENNDEIGIVALREENVPGTHTVFYTSEEDTIEITHTAHSRRGFALGAVLAAEFIHDKKGILTINDMLKLS